MRRCHKTYCLPRAKSPFLSELEGFQISLHCTLFRLYFERWKNCASDFQKIHSYYLRRTTQFSAKLFITSILNIWINKSIYKHIWKTFLISEFSFILQNASVQVAGQGQVQGSDTQGGPNTVLRVIVEHMLYPISLDILYQVSVFYSFCSDMIENWNFGKNKISTRFRKMENSSLFSRTFRYKMNGVYARKHRIRGQDFNPP